VAYPKNQRDRDKADVFELALARASRQVEMMAKRAAAELRAQRLQADRAARATAGLATVLASDPARTNRRSDRGLSRPLEV
jgi:hypothetical protein